MAEDGGGAERTDGWSRIDGAARVAEASEKLKRLGLAAPSVRARARALDLLGLKPAELVIDVGAGSGIVTAEIARKITPGGRVFAIDPSPGLLEEARKYTLAEGISHHIDFRVADGRALPFGAAFDAALCHWVLLHVDQPEKVVAEMKRVTRRGGRVLSVELDWETAMVSPGDRTITRKILHNAIDKHVEPWIGRRLPGIFAAAGFDEVRVHPSLIIDQGREDRAWLEWLLEKASLALENAVITRDDYADWSDGLDAAQRRGNFFFAVVQFAVIGRLSL